MLQILGLAALGFVLALLVVAALKPARYRVQRSTTVQAPPEQIYPHLADFRRWRAWSPWEGLDPQLVRSHSGAASGVGAVYAWEGNKQAGAGRMEIVEAAPPSHLGIQLDFTRPFPSHNTIELDLESHGAATDVTWSMHGPQPFMLRLMTIFMSMDKLVGNDFEKGLASLKAVAEQPGQGAPTG